MTITRTAPLLGANLDDFTKSYDPDEHLMSHYCTPEGDKLEVALWPEPVQVWEVNCADLSI